MWFLKRRFLIALLCLLASAGMTWKLFDTVESTKQTETVVHANGRIDKGTRISADMLATAEVGSFGLDPAAIRLADEAVGMYAAADIFPGDCITAEKLDSDDDYGADFARKASELGKAVVSVNVNGISASLAGKLRRGDVVSCVTFIDSANGMPNPMANGEGSGNRGYVKTYPDLMYVEVIAVSNSHAGEIGDKNTAGMTDGLSLSSGSSDSAIPASVTFIADEAQALSLIEAGHIGQVHLIFRGRGKHGRDLLEAAASAAAAATAPEGAGVALAAGGPAEKYDAAETGGAPGAGGNLATGGDIAASGSFTAGSYTTGDAAATGDASTAQNGFGLRYGK